MSDEHPLCHETIIRTIIRIKFHGYTYSSPKPIKGIVMQIEEALINGRLRVSKLS